MPKKVEVDNTPRGKAMKRRAAQEEADEAKAAERSEKTLESHWSSGAKSNAKKDAAAAKKAEAAAKKAEVAKALADEEASQPDKPVKASTGNKKAAIKRTNKSPGSSIDGALSAINATGIDDALDALSLTEQDNKQAGIDRHPERRVKAAYAAYEQRRLPEMKEENRGLRQNQMKELIRKEFEKSAENPFNQANAVAHNATREEIEASRLDQKAKVEARLASGK